MGSQHPDISIKDWTLTSSGFYRKASGVLAQRHSARVLDPAALKDVARPKGAPEVYEVAKGKSAELCGGGEQISIFSEHFARCDQCNDILPDSVFEQCMQLGRQFAEREGYFRVTPKMLGVGKDGTARLWHSENMAKQTADYPSNQQTMVKSLVQCAFLLINPQSPLGRKVLATDPLPSSFGSLFQTFLAQQGPSLLRKQPVRTQVLKSSPTLQAEPPRRAGKAQFFRKEGVTQIVNEKEVDGKLYKQVWKVPNQFMPHFSQRNQ